MGTLVCLYSLHILPANLTMLKLFCVLLVVSVVAADSAVDKRHGHGGVRYGGRYPGRHGGGYYGGGRYGGRGRYHGGGHHGGHGGHGGHHGHHHGHHHGPPPPPPPPMNETDAAFQAGMAAAQGGNNPSNLMQALQSLLEAIANNRQG